MGASLKRPPCVEKDEGLLKQPSFYGYGQKGPGAFSSCLPSSRKLSFVSMTSDRSGSADSRALNERCLLPACGIGEITVVDGHMTDSLIQ
jgi:hypothetical protein